MAESIDFRQMKEQVRLTTVLAHYDIELKHKSDDEKRGKCPIHNGDNETSFSVWLSKDTYHCFSCGAKGNILQFIQDMEDAEDVRSSALYIQKHIQSGSYTRQKGGKKRNRANGATTTEKPRRNAPVDAHWQREYEAKLAPPELEGFKTETLKHFHCGIAKRGVHKGKVVSPVWTENHECIGYVATDGNDSSLPKGYNIGGDLYNVDRMNAKQSVLVVSDVRDVWKLYEMGWENVVATITQVVSETQTEILQALLPERAKLLLMVDKNFYTTYSLERLCHYFYVKVKLLEQPLYKQAMLDD